MRPYILPAFAVLALSACHKEPYWDDVCVKHKTVLTMMPLHAGKDTIMSLQPVVICTARQSTCIIPDGYDGDWTCPPIKDEDIKKEAGK